MHAVMMTNKKQCMHLQLCSCVCICDGFGELDVKQTVLLWGRTLLPSTALNSACMRYACVLQSMISKL